MDAKLIEIVGKYAGLAGFSLGLILIVFRAILKSNSNTFPKLNTQQAYSLLRLLIVLTFAAGAFGIGAWAFLQQEKPRIAQITGHVTDKETKEALVDQTQITLSGRKEWAATDERGNFFLILLPPLPEGKAHLFIYKKGYEPFEAHLEMGENLDDAELIPRKKVDAEVKPTKKLDANELPAARPLKAPGYKNIDDHGLRHFYTLNTSYALDHQRRDWYQESPSTWNEIHEDSLQNHWRVVDADAVVDGNRGIVCVADNTTLRLFIPNPDADGKNPTWLRIQEHGGWQYLAPRVEVSGGSDSSSNR